MPAYNAEKTLEKTFKDIPKGLAYEVILVDDASTDKTIKIAKKLGITVIPHKENLGYGGNQKTCYDEALKKGADIIIMLHPDYQYDATRLGELVRPIQEGRYDAMFGSRIRTRQEALQGGMPVIKYILNRLLTPIENIILGVNFSEHLSGLRAYSREVVKKVPYRRFSDDFLFDQQFMASTISYGFRISEIPVPVRYFDEASSIGLKKGSIFLLGTTMILFGFVLHKAGLVKSKWFAK